VDGFARGRCSRHGQLGLENDGNSEVPKRVAALSSRAVSKVRAGVPAAAYQPAPEAHEAALQRTQQCGVQCTHGHTPCSCLSNGALVARQVACGSMHTLAIADGRVYGWGSNECVVLHCVATLCCNDVVLCGNMHHRHDFIHTGPMKY
jgi:hypothetical protein